jgi:CRISPR system Cascade subunit CasC
MFVEVHILQNFALSNLNRDDTGAPKDCEFGGYRRARVSSQCIKRAIRTYFRDNALLSTANLAVRTRHLANELAARLAGAGKSKEEALRVARAALSAISLTVKDKDRTEYLLFVGNSEVAALAQVCDTYWDKLLAAADMLAAASDGGSGEDAQAGRRRRPKKAPIADLSVVADELQACLGGGEAADLALFGRMIADRPDKNVEAACQVAHAISTNRVSVEFDFFTAVDDIPDYDPEAGMGAGMMGTVQLSSSCYYRYANLDLQQLLVNLHGNERLAKSGIAAFLEASALAVPTGKQTGTAAQNPPSLVAIVARERGLWSLANAFVEPVAPDGQGDLVRNSIRALVDYWQRIAGVYGTSGIRYVGAVSTEDADVGSIVREPSLDALLSKALEQVQFEHV